MDLATTAADMVDLLKAGMVEKFRSRYQLLVKEESQNPFEIAEAINKRIKELDPESDSKIIVSQKTNSEKHIVMIMDSSRFFGESFTVTRQMFVVE